MEDLRKAVHAVMDQASHVILGKNKQIAAVMAALLADGHVLLEDMPGVGKTTLAMVFARSMRLDCRRMQFTPDVLPSDLTGFSIYRREEERFVYQQGALFCHLLLADELNRTSPKTQSALLEAMEERRVSVEGVSRELPKPFLVIATQNPYGSAGTQPLPQAQSDRFMISLSLGYPDLESEVAMALGIREESALSQVVPCMDAQDLLMAQREVCGIHLAEALARYAVELVRATRIHPDLRQGGSPRVVIALVRMARAKAWLAGRAFVMPHDVMDQFPTIIRHRIVSARSLGAQRSVDEVIKEILGKVRAPSLGRAR